MINTNIFTSQRLIVISLESYGFWESLLSAYSFISLILSIYSFLNKINKNNCTSLYKI